MFYQNFVRLTLSIIVLVALTMFSAPVNAETPQETIQRCTTSIKANPNDYKAYNEIGIAYYDLKDYKKAIRYYTKALQLNPNDGETYFNRGKCYEALGDTVKAQADFTKAKKLGYKG